MTTTRSSTASVAARGTTLNNAEGVSVEEALGSMRHASVSATRTYIVRDNVPEAKKFAAYAYGLKPNMKKRG